MDKLCHRHLSGVTISDGELRFTLHSKVTVSIPYRKLSLEHRQRRFGPEACAHFLLSDDWQEITWPQLGVMLMVDDILEQWTVSPKIGPLRMDAEVEKYLNNPGDCPRNSERLTFTPKEIEDNIRRQYSRTDDPKENRELSELCRRVERLELIVNPSVMEDRGG